VHHLAFRKPGWAGAAVLAWVLVAGIAAGQGFVPTPPSEAGRYEKVVPPVRPAGAGGPVDLSALLPPIGSQNWGSCVSWAVGYYYKAVQEAAEHHWSPTTADHQFNPYFIYNQANGGVDGGLTFPSAFDLLCAKGCPTRADWTFNGADYNTWPNADQMTAALPYRAADYAYIFLGQGSGGGTALATMKALLDTGHIFVMAIPVYNDFSSESGLPAPGYYYDGPAQGASYLGGHAITIVGYDDSRGAHGGLKMANSWGTWWGDAGYCWLSYDFVANYAWEAWTMTDRVGYQPLATARFDITHTYRQDLTVVVGVGNPSSPTWSTTVYSNDGGSYDNMHAAADLTEGVSYLPPSSTHPWFLRVTDSWAQDGGTLDGFSIRYGGHEYVATDVPQTISADAPCVVTSTITAPENHPPAAPTLVLAPTAPACASAVTATASGGADPDGDDVQFSYTWSRWNAGSSQWLQQRSLLTSATSDTLPSGSLAKGQRWRCSVYATDGVDASDAVAEEFTVANTAPSAPSMALAPSPPASNQDVTATLSGATDPDTDTLTYAYRWSLWDEGAGSWVTQRFVAAGGAVDTLAEGLTTKGQLWKCYARANDGEALSTPVEKQFRISNAVPTRPTLALSPTAPTSANDMGASVSGVTDPDGDALTYTYRWFVWAGGAWTLKQTADKADTTDTLPAAVTAKGERWKCSVRAGDGAGFGGWAEAEFRIGNTPPGVPTLTVTPRAPGSAGNLVASVVPIEDPDGDVIKYAFRWVLGGKTKRLTVSSSPTDTLPEAYTRRDQVWSCVAWVGDGTALSAEATVEVTIGNSPPPAPGLTLEPTQAAAGGAVTVRAEAVTDPDGDRVVYGYRWLLNGEAKRTRVASATSDTLPAGTTHQGETWTVVVRAGDGHSTGDPATLHFTVGEVGGASVAWVTALSAVPTPGGAQVVFTLSAPARVQAEVLNIAGRPVKLLAADRECAAGTQTLVWTGQSDAGLPVPNGRYLIRLTARGADGASSQALSTVLIER